MLPQTIFLLATTLSAVAAGPVKKRQAKCSSSGVHPVPSATASVRVPAPPSASAPAAPAAGPSLPSTGSGTQLPAASGQLQHIVVGHGIQNYTCVAADSKAATSTGALAVLYEITDLAPGSSSPGSSIKAAMSQTAWSQLTAEVLRKTDLPLNIVGNAMTPYSAAIGAPFKGKSPDADLAMSNGTTPMKAIGRHYFDAKGVPTFDLYATGQRLSAKKLNDAPAPAGADKGIMDTGAVAWLRLGDNGSGLSKGLSEVYRVYTAGGASIACSQANTTISVPYTAQYWFYA